MKSDGAESGHDFDGEGLLLERRMRALSGLDGPAFLKLEKRFARVLAEELAQRTRAGQPRKR